MQGDVFETTTTTAAAAVDPQMQSRATGAIDDLDQLLMTVNKVDETQLYEIVDHTR